MKYDKLKAVCILSGGLDSTTLLYDLKNKGYDIYAISFDYGQKHKLELNMARKTCEKLKVHHKVLKLNVLNEVAPSALTRGNINIPQGNYNDKNMKVTVVPNRNMVMISLAVSYAIGIKADKVFYGAHKGDHTIYPDCRNEFVVALHKAVELCDWWHVELIAPFLDMDKGDIVILGTDLGVNYKLTRTCYENKKLACGKCGSCRERLEAFEKAGREDVIEYQK